MKVVTLPYSFPMAFAWKMRAVACCLALSTLGGCLNYGWRAQFTHNVRDLDDSPYLKLHTADGRVFVFALWQVTDTAVTGEGLMYNPERLGPVKGQFSVPRADIALAEGDAAEAFADTPANVGLAVVAGLGVAVVVFGAWVAYIVSNINFQLSV